MKYYNIHTHKPAEEQDVVSVVNRIITDDNSGMTGETGYYSCGIHPWYISNPEKQLAQLRQTALLSNIVAIGEAGLDKLAETPMETQIFVFKEQILLTEEIRKPLIIHCVKAWDELLALKKEYAPKQPWIIHGFRRNGEQAGQLIQHGLYLSFGEYFNPHALLKAWPYLLAETDERNADIRSIYQLISDSLSIPEDIILSQIAENVHKIFSLSE